MKIKLSTILIITGGIIWLSITFFVYSYRYSTYSAATESSSFYSSRNYVDRDSILFTEAKYKLTLILFRDNMVLGYYGDSIQNPEVVTIEEIDKLIQNGWKKYSKKSLFVFIKQTKEADMNAFGKALKKMKTNQVENVLAIRLNKKEKEFLKLNQETQVRDHY